MNGYQDANVFGPVYNQLLEYDSWQNKQLGAGAREHDVSNSATASTG